MRTKELDTFLTKRLSAKDSDVARSASPNDRTE